LLLNATRIFVDERWLRVRQGPVPWAGGRQIPVKEIEQLYVGWDVYKGVKSRARIYTFRLCARLAGGSEQVLVSGPLDADQARALEAVLEKHLGIVDRPVKGEWHR